MNDYHRVREALDSGVEPKLLCATCPWDRYCIEPPSMTKADIEKVQAEARQQDEEAEARSKAEGKEHKGLPVGTLLTTLMFAGKDTSARLCPVFALRLRSSQGRAVVDSVKEGMQAWDDNA